MKHEKADQEVKREAFLRQLERNYGHDYYMYSTDESDYCSKCCWSWQDHMANGGQCPEKK